MLTNSIGTLLILVKGILNFTLFTVALVIFIHVGSSSKSVSTFSLSSRKFNSPSPLNVLMLIFSTDKFFANLQETTINIVTSNNNIKFNNEIKVVYSLLKPGAALTDKLKSFLLI